MFPVIALRKASCWACIASNPGIFGIIGLDLTVSAHFVWLSRNISKDAARNCGTDEVACVV